MGFLILKEEIVVADADIDCDACALMIFSLNKKCDVTLEFKDIRIFTEALRDKRKIKKGTTYAMCEILNDETGEVKEKNFRTDVIELVYKYGFAPKWLITARKINSQVTQ